MKYYQDENNNVIAFTDIAIINNPDLIKLTNKQLEAYNNKPDFGVWNGNEWIEDIELKKEYEKSLIPKTITLRQARLYLLSIELLDDLENIISQNRAYQIEWEYANNIERESPLVKILGQALELNDERIDEMFTEASKL